ncbi:MAG: ATP-binding cassette domain-containing protein, partial [Promethearchaeota archaeon]
FREKEYTFKRSASGRTWSNAKIFARYGKISKTFESFRLSMNPGTIYASEILGVVGENGCGKSTFAKILAGELQPDSGSEFEGIQAIVSYKPQYITQEFSQTVRDFIIDVFICSCLAKRADLYILDEPSAYLDVEERIHIGQIIRTITKRNNAVAICIEHDIQIADSLIDRLLLFTGKPGVHGKTIGPLNKREGMNLFLKEIDVTFRRDTRTGRARLNKKGSQLDRAQRASGQLWGVR